AANPLFEQVQNKAEKFQTVINKAGQRVASEASSVRNNLTSFDINDVIKRTYNSKANDSNGTNLLNTTKPIHQSSTPDLYNEKSIPYERFTSQDNISSPEPLLINGDQISSSSSDSSHSSTPELNRYKNAPLINLDIDDNPLLPSPITLNVINTPLATPVQRQVPQIDSKIKQLQSELQYKVQTFDGKRTDPRDEYGQQQTEIKKLVKQFDPLDDDTNFLNKPTKNVNTSFTSMPVNFRSNEKPISNTVDRHPSIYETIPTNRVTAVLNNIQTNYGTTNRFTLRPTYSMQQPQSNNNNNNLTRFSPASTAPASLFPKICSTIPDDSLSFDPLAPSKETILYSNIPSTTSPSGSNLIDFS
ncbi:unnamed protein product, partial [Adineta steineri]